MSFAPGVVLPWLVDEINARTAVEPPGQLITFAGDCERVNNLVASSASALTPLFRIHEELAAGIVSGEGLDPIKPEGSVPDVAFTNLRPMTGIDMNQYFSGLGSSPPTFPPASWAISGYPVGITITTGGILQGTPDDANITAGTGRVTVTDTEGNTAFQDQNFTRVRLGNIATKGVTPHQLWAEGEAVSVQMSTYFTNEADDGTYNAIAYEVTDSVLPDGVTLHPTSGLLSGTPAAGSAQNTIAYDITATDERGNEAVQTFNITVRGPVRLVGTIPPQNFEVGTAITTIVGSNYFSNPSSSPPSHPITGYAASNLPDGVEINPSTGDIDGTPTAGDTNGTATVIATDDRGNQGQQPFNWSVASGLVDIYKVGTIPDKLDWLVGVDITEFDTAANFSNSSSSPPSYDAQSYELLANPTGIVINTGPGRVSGRPQGPQETPASMSVRATATNNSQATQDFNYRVKYSPIRAVGSVPDQGPWRKQVDITEFDLNPYFSTSVSTPPTYNPDTIQTAGFPSGVTVDPLGILTGTPDATTSPGSGTGRVTVTDTDGNTAFQDINWTLELSPMAAKTGLGPYTWTENAQITPLDAATFFSSEADTPPTYPPAAGSYQAVGLPDNLIIDPLLGGISGTPAASGSGTFTVSAQDTAGNPRVTTASISYTSEPPVAGCTV